MTKSLFEQMGGTYRWEGDYLVPNIELPENKPIGKYGMLRETFLKEHRNYLYVTMMMKGTLNEHLFEVDQAAKQQVDEIVSKMAETDGVDEKFKADNPTEWVQKMNGHKQAAEETVLAEYVYA